MSYSPDLLCHRIPSFRRALRDVRTDETFNFGPVVLKHEQVELAKNEGFVAVVLLEPSWGAYEKVKCVRTDASQRPNFDLQKESETVGYRRLVGFKRLNIRTVEMTNLRLNRYGLLRGVPPQSHTAS